MLPRSPRAQVQVKPDALAPAGYALFDRDLRFVDANETLATLHGVPLATYASRALADVLPTVAPQVEEALHQVLATGQSFEQTELASEAVEGRFLRASYYPVQASNGFVMGVEMRVQEAAPAGKTPYDDNTTVASDESPLFALAPTGIIRTDTAGRILDANPRMCELTGYSRAELLAMRLAELAHPTEQENGPISVEDMPEGLGVEQQYRHKNGQDMWVRLTRHAVRDAPNALQHNLFFVEDLSQQHLASEQIRIGTAALRRSEAKFAAAFKAGPIILTITRLADGRFIDVNESFLTISGFTREETIGRTPLELGVWLQPGIRTAGLSKLRQGEPIRGIETDFRLKNGEICTCLLAADVIFIDDEPCALTALTDITSRKQAERLLERYHLLSQYTRDIVLFIRLDGQIIDANDAAVAAYGYDRDTLLAMNLRDLRDTSTLPSLDEQFSRATQEGLLFETVHRRQDGSLFPVEVSAVGATIDNEHLMLSIVRDISDRTQAEAERSRLLDQLSHERRQLEEVLRQLPVGVIIAEAPSGKLILGNAQTERIWRQPFIASHNISQYVGYRGFHADGRPYQPEEWPMARALTNGAFVQRERIQIQRGDGSSGIIEVNAAPIRDETGGIRAGVITFQDVSAQERATQALQFLAETSASLISSLEYDSTLDAAAQLATSGLAEWCIINMLQPDGTIATARVAHADPKKVEMAWELVRLYPLDPNAPSGTPRVIRTGETELLPEVSDELLNRAVRHKKHARTLSKLGFRSICSAPLRVGKQIVGAIVLASSHAGHFSDSDKATIEEFARRIALALDHARLYAEAQAAVGVRDQFLSIASHELRTPLTVVLGYISLLHNRLKLGATVSERDQKAVEIIFSQANRLNTLIGSLLDISRLQMGQLSIAALPMDLSALVRQVVEEIKPSLERHDLKLSLPDAPAIINGDVMRLEQVIQNLIQNAVKYSPKGGPVEVSVFERDNHTYLVVRDEGIGIPATSLPQLFIRFYRAQNVEAARISGMGLGLFVVREIMSLHGGTVDVESTEGQGSRFMLVFPSHAR